MYAIHFKIFTNGGSSMATAREGNRLSLPSILPVWLAAADFFSDHNIKAREGIGEAGRERVCM
jgi:hypothetical protein